MKILSWNMAHRVDPWYQLLDTDADLALLQEAAEPPPEVASRVEVNPGAWQTAGADAQRKWRTAVVRLSDRISADWIKCVPIADAGSEELAVCLPGTLAAARVTSSDGEPFLAVSIYSVWGRPHASTGSSWIVSDASAHRVVSDLSALIGSQHGHRVLVAGDFNILHGYGEHSSPYWEGRYETVFTRMEALGLRFVGPQAPNGRQADPWPVELPRESKNVPTFYYAGQGPTTATRQLDYAFASRALAENVKVRAMNDPEEWGPSDHCRLEIEF